ncbi:MAG: hypothetical protein AAFX57_19230, partial [Bacteroidota bacterium]
MKILIFLILFSISASTLYSQNKYVVPEFDSTNLELQKNAYELLSTSPMFDLFKKMILLSGSKALYTQDSSRLTYIIVSNDGIESEKLKEHGQGLSQDLFRAMIKGYVIKEKMNPNGFNDVSKVTTLDGLELNVINKDGEIFLGG